jgi:two-component system sensor histidine kinase PilS (NtrC family)
MNAVISSREFDLISVAPVLDAKPIDGELVSWAGSTYLASRSFLSIPGWSVVLLGSIADILLYRLAGLLATLIVALVISTFSAVGQISLMDEARVERSESLYRALIEGSPNWVSIVDTTGAFTFTNRAGRESLGISEAGSADGRIENLIGPDHVGEIAANVGVALRGSIATFETVLPSTSGDAKVWRITLVPLRAAGQEPTAILIGNDVTEMRGAEARLVRAERMAALGTLAAGVAHQFNNINAVAMGYLQVLEAEPGLSEKTMKYLGSVRGALERSVLITARLLPLSTPQIEQAPAFLLEDAVRSVLSMVQPDLDREGVTLDLSLEPGVAASITGEQLSFIVEALLVNAWHATLGQKVRRIQVGTGSKDGKAFLRVEDTGIGIAKEKLSSLFTPFFTEKGEHAMPQSPQAQVRGVGLSLAVAHSMVSARGGRIEIQSEHGGGSRFTVWLPRG